LEYSGIYTLPLYEILHERYKIFFINPSISSLIRKQLGGQNKNDRLKTECSFLDRMCRMFQANRLTARALSFLYPVNPV